MLIKFCFSFFLLDGVKWRGRFVSFKNHSISCEKFPKFNFFRIIHPIKVKKENRFWNQFQAFFNSIPESIVKILIASGYDNAISISELCEDEIKIIETYANNNLKHLIEETETYKTHGQFQFLPGHKKLLYALPIRVAEYHNRKSKKPIENQPNTATDEVELLTPEELNKLKNGLIGKLNTNIKDIDVQFTEQSLTTGIDAYISHGRKTGNNATYKCIVSCVLCEKKISCTWNKRWQTSNLEKHVKSHSNAKNTTICSITKPNRSNDNNENDTASEIQQNENFNESSEIQQRKNSQISYELMHVLEITEK